MRELNHWSFALLLFAFGISNAEAATRCSALYVKGHELWVSDGGVERFLLSDSMGIRLARWSPDGTRIAYVHDLDNPTAEHAADIMMIDRDRSMVAIANLTWEDLVTSIDRVGWHGNDAVWIEGHVNPSTDLYYEWNVRTKERVAEIPGIYFSWSPDGRHLAHLEHIRHFTSEVHRTPAVVIDDRAIWRPSGEDETRRYLSPMVWSVDGTSLAFVLRSADGTSLDVLDVREKTLMRSIPLGDNVAASSLRWEGDVISAAGFAVNARTGKKLSARRAATDTQPKRQPQDTICVPAD